MPEDLMEALRRDPDDDEALAVEMLVSRIVRLFGELRGKSEPIAADLAERLAREIGAPKRANDD